MAINGQAFKGLAAGLTVSELCALYFSRTLLESLSGTPFRDEVESAFEKLGVGADAAHAAVSRSAAARDRDQGRSDAAAATIPRQQQIIARALEATLHLRQATLTYHSKSSDRTKTYLVHPYRLALRAGRACISSAYVPEYSEVRTFAVERIQEISLLEERFTPIEELPDDAVPALARRALGSARARGNRVSAGGRRLRARARMASVAAASRQRRRTALRLTLDVCLDRALQSWILSFGPFARVDRAGRARARDRGTVRRSEGAVCRAGKAKWAGVVLNRWDARSCSCSRSRRRRSRRQSDSRPARLIDRRRQGDRQRRDRRRQRSHHLGRHRALRPPARR